MNHRQNRRLQDLIFDMMMSLKSDIHCRVYSFISSCNTCYRLTIENNITLSTKTTYNITFYMPTNSIVFKCDGGTKIIIFFGEGVYSQLVEEIKSLMITIEDYIKIPLPDVWYEFIHTLLIHKVEDYG